jgi:hypothetical protein
VEIRDLQRILAARARRAFQKGQINEGLAEVLCGMNYARHIITGSPVLIQYMVGIVVIRQVLAPLEEILASNSFNKEQLISINQALTQLEVEIPLISTSFDVETKLMKLSLAHIALFTPFEHAVLMKANMPTNYITLRFRLLPYVFSPRLATLNALDFGDKVLSAFTSIEKGEIGKSLEERKKLVYEIEKFHEKNPMAIVVPPNIYKCLDRKIKLVGYIRMLNLAVLLRSHYLDNLHFPRSLQEITSDLTIDPTTGKLWYYTVEKDSVIVSSPGYDQEYDTKDDLRITLEK